MCGRTIDLCGSFRLATAGVAAQRYLMRTAIVFLVLLSACASGRSDMGVPVADVDHRDEFEHERGQVCSAALEKGADSCDFLDEIPVLLLSAKQVLFLCGQSDVGCQIGGWDGRIVVQEGYSNVSGVVLHEYVHAAMDYLRGDSRDNTEHGPKFQTLQATAESL